MADTPADTGAYTDFAKAMSYGDYLQLDTLLSAQKPLSEQSDELLFIIIHQSTELWMKLVLHELGLAITGVREDRLQPALKNLARVGRIQAQMIQSWDVLSTMTPAEYSAFRDSLGRSSGFQSVQNRRIEFMLGNKQEAMIAPHRHDAALSSTLDEALRAPSLYDEAIALLARRGFAIEPAMLKRDFRAAHASNDSVRAAWLQIYRDPDRYWDLYQLAEKLVDVDDWFQQWRFRHMTTVKRIIGFKRGTGGTDGVGYLRRAVDITLFPELWDLRTEL
ncbi:MAG: tryptophan 2,3-dioxygenase [Hydrocarboniphaga sp.]|uniref:tryptophan 2,3-dioxygenase n=1 Tax=Hydrocarboniphaga sp. TaxID=2033016 RepID=UPI00260DE6E6|nr:tryptophan 2,3-dioxygenase [Hydrocarboniphaga sp.]MDB5969386.1 tryptophan 2,3-dioxygenase [Hydrocarboniphaga sp.]